MPVNLSIENVPDEIADQLRQRAEANHRSLQGELMTILEDAVAGNRGITIGEARRRVQERGLETPSEATEMIRAARDGR